MEPIELEELGIVIAGPADAWRWQTVLAGKLEVDVSTVNRWVNGRSPIKGTIASFIRTLAQQATAARSAALDDKGG
jgi:hypothetical protein